MKLIISLLHREEQRLDEAFGGMMPDELPGAVAAVAEVWLDDAYDNITLAQTCLAARKQQEEKRAAALGKHPEPPDGEVSAEKARSLWIQRALRQTSYVSHMAKEMDDYSVETKWSIWSYERYRRSGDKGDDEAGGGGEQGGDHDHTEPADIKTVVGAGDPLAELLPQGRFMNDQNFKYLFPRIIFVLFYDVHKENMFTINLEDGREAPSQASNVYCNTDDLLIGNSHLYPHRSR